MARAMALPLALLILAPCAAMATTDDRYCRTVNVTGYEQYYIPSVSNGDMGQGVQPFVIGRDEAIARGTAVGKIRIWVGQRYMTGLEVTLTDSTVHMYGHKKDESTVHTFSNSEYLTYYAQYKSTNSDKVAGIKFKTNTGYKFDKAASEHKDLCQIGCDTCLVKSIGSGILVGFQGVVCDPTGTGDICQLTPIIMRTIVGAELTNMSYPTLSDAPPPMTSVIYDYPVYNDSPEKSVTKFTHSITEKKSLTWNVGVSLKFTYTTNFKTSVSGGAPAVGAVSTEMTQQYTWEIGVTASVGMTYEKTETWTQEFTFTCPAYTSCRFVVSQGVGSLVDRFNECTALYTVYLDSGTSMPYVVTGNVVTDQISPYSQSIISEPIFPAAGAVAAPLPPGRAPSNFSDGQGQLKAPALLHRGPGSPPMLMYRKCPRVNKTQLCTRRTRAPAAVVRALGQRLMMSDRAITKVQDNVTFYPGHILVNYAAPFNNRRGPPKLRD